MSRVPIPPEGERILYHHSLTIKIFKIKTNYRHPNFELWNSNQPVEIGYSPLKCDSIARTIWVLIQ